MTAHEARLAQIIADSLNANRGDRGVHAVLDAVTNKGHTLRPGRFPGIARRRTFTPSASSLPTWDGLAGACSEALNMIFERHGLPNRIAITSGRRKKREV